MTLKQILIIDFGSQYTRLITRKFRELGFSSEIVTVDQAKFVLSQKNRPKAVVLSGGPQSVFEDEGDYSFIFKIENLPIMGICYGMQLIAKKFGAKILKGDSAEYGAGEVLHLDDFKIDNCPDQHKVWMSHSDHVTELPKTLKAIMKSSDDIIAAIKHTSSPILGFQFHPEVYQSEYGEQILLYFLNRVAKISPDWNSSTIYAEAMDKISHINNESVLCAFSGGVDSLVAASLVAKNANKGLHCFFIDNGLLRPQDLIHIKMLQEQTSLNIKIIDAGHEFLTKLEGISDPEEKRKIIGGTFIDVFEKQVKLYEKERSIHFKYLLQGTLYTDVIESMAPHKKGGKSVTIKSHHNVGGLPETMQLSLLEPLNGIFKDEVRILGKKLGLNDSWINRHPFPGPGIGIRIMGEITEDKIQKVQQSDQILYEELIGRKLYDSVWQAFTIFLPVKTVGIKGDDRAYEDVICIRLVNSTDGMTANWVDLGFEFLNNTSRRITNEVTGITRVVLDITSKPPGTIEWE